MPQGSVLGPLWFGLFILHVTQNNKSPSESHIKSSLQLSKDPPEWVELEGFPNREEGVPFPTTLAPGWQPV